VDTGDSPQIAEIEASIKKGCGEWGNAGDKGIARGGGIAVFVITSGIGTLNTQDVTAWAQSQTSLQSPMNTYAVGTPQANELRQIISERCSGSTVEEKVRSVNRLLFDWFWYNSGGQRDAYTVLHGARENGAWGTQCDGYARSMVALLRTWGVKARYISGYAITYNGGPGGGAHAWVQVWNGSEWRMVDPTWNDPVVSEEAAFWYPDGYIEANYLNRWMMLKTINGDRVITNEGGDYGPGSPKFHNARL
jgi:transglutaminase-like putative cysteine protease